MADVQVGVQHGHDDVGLAKALPHGLDHGLAQTAAHLRQAGRIHEDGLGIVVRQDAHDLVAGGLGLGRDDGHLLAHEPVQQRRFAGIGRAHERHPAATVILTVHYFSSYICNVSIHSRPIRRLTPRPTDRGRADRPSLKGGGTEKDFIGFAVLSIPLFPPEGGGLKPQRNF